jgi:hypothetical protein
MKKHAKLFEEFIKEEGLDDLLGGGAGAGAGGDAEKKPDPIKKMQDEEKKKKEKAEEIVDDHVDKNLEKIKKLLDDHPEINDEIGKKVIDAVESKDRIKIHNVFNDLVYMQVKYQKAGDLDKVSQITGIKNIVDSLDKSFGSTKMI